MSLTSVYFIIFIIILLLLYYLVPKKYQWIVLLVASMVFYSFCGLRNFLILLLIALISYLSAILIQKKYDDQSEYLKANKETLDREAKSRIKKQAKEKCRIILLIGVMLELSLLVLFKSNILESVIIPLGMSYYTLQTIGYVTDVYRKTTKAEVNFFKVLLFVSFFPQITQGPISDWEELSAELFGGHSFEYKNYSYGTQRILWGFFKKMVIADTMALYVSDAFADYAEYSSLALFIGMIFCMVRLYADFSGYMDIVCGVSEIMGIRLTENFRRPFFSKSLSEFWTRWHISLGAWFKKYVFYPVGKSGVSKKAYASSQKVFGDLFAERIPTTFALFSVWTLIGIWHGATLPFFLWGIFNGIIMISTVWLEPVYNRMKETLHIKNDSMSWKIFRIIRTFLLVSLLEVVSDVGTVKDGFGYIRCMFVNRQVPASVKDVLPFVDLENASRMNAFAVAMFGLVLMFVVSVIQRKKQVRDHLACLAMPVRIILMVGLFYMIVVFGIEASINNSGGFLYAQF